MKRIGLLIVILAINGCGGGPPTGNLSGKVLFKGEPLEEGTVTLLAADNKSFQCTIVPAAKGAYEFNRIPLGEAKLTVISPDSLLEPGSLVEKEPLTFDNPEKTKKFKEAWLKKKAADAARKNRQPVSHIFRSIEKSPLKFTIQAGSNSYDINLK